MITLTIKNNIVLFTMVIIFVLVYRMNIFKYMRFLNLMRKHLLETFIDCDDLLQY